MGATALSATRGQQTQTYPRQVSSLVLVVAPSQKELQGPGERRHRLVCAGTWGQQRGSATSCSPRPAHTGTRPCPVHLPPLPPGFLGPAAQSCRAPPVPLLRSRPLTARSKGRQALALKYSALTPFNSPND